MGGAGGDRPRPTVSITDCSQSRSGLRPANVSGRVMFSMAVSVGTRLKAWKMKPTRSRLSWVSCRSFRLLRSVSPMYT